MNFDEIENQIIEFDRKVSNEYWTRNDVLELDNLIDSLPSGRVLKYAIEVRYRMKEVMENRRRFDQDHDEYCDIIADSPEEYDKSAELDQAYWERQLKYATEDNSNELQASKKPEIEPEHPKEIIDLAKKAHTFRGTEEECKNLRRYIEENAQTISLKVALCHSLNKTFTGAVMGRILGTDQNIIYRNVEYIRLFSKKKSK